MSQDRTLDLTKATLKPKPTREPLRIEQVFDVEFNENQLKHYWGVRTFVGFPKGVLTAYDIDQAREWLGSSRYRNNGRSLLLALCFLEYAASNPGKRVNIFDHHSTTTGQIALMKILRDFVSRHPLFERQVTYYGVDDASFIFNPIRGL